jgi:hypothetical protein
MLERFKKALVDSFVGAICLGWIFAQAILHFVGIFSTPVASWIIRREYRSAIADMGTSQCCAFQEAVPELLRCVGLFLLGYFLLRWLYYKSPTAKEEATAEPPAHR